MSAGARAPRVSLLVPTYKGEAFLGETLASALAQTMGDLEVVVLDDLSPDGTLDVAHDFARQDSRVRVIAGRERAGSGPKNANRSLAHATGTWIKFLFQDDVMRPTCLARMLEAGEAGPLVLAWHDYHFMPGVDDGTRAGYLRLPTLASEFADRFIAPEPFARAVLRHLFTNFLGPTSSSLIHRRVFATYGAFDAAMSSFPDLDYWTRVGGREGLAIAPEPLVTFRVHDGSVSARIRSDPRLQFQGGLHALRLLYKMCHEPTHAVYRAVASEPGVARDLGGMLRVGALDALWEAIDAKYRAGDRTLLDLWSEFRQSDAEMGAVLHDIERSRPLLTRARQRIKAGW